MTRRKKPPPPTCQVPGFVPVPMRRRRDGWTPRRQAAFLGYLAETRSVAEAARRVNMARETAYRLRARAGAESFAAAWDAALGQAQGGDTAPRKVTADELYSRAVFGVLKPRLYAGRYTGTERKTDENALLHLMFPDRRRAGFGGGKSHVSRADLSPLQRGWDDAGVAGMWWPRGEGEGE